MATRARTGNADVVTEDETAGGGDETGEEDIPSHLAGIVLAARRTSKTTAGHDRKMRSGTIR